MKEAECTTKAGKDCNVNKEAVRTNLSSVTRVARRHILTKEADRTTIASKDSNDSKEAVRTTEANRYQNRLTQNKYATCVRRPI